MGEHSSFGGEILLVVSASSICDGVVLKVWFCWDMPLLLFWLMRLILSMYLLMSKLVTAFAPLYCIAARSYAVAASSWVPSRL